MDFLLYFLLFYMWHSLGIAVGYHRLLAHNAKKVSKPVLYFLVLGAYLAIQGSPIPWSGIHRYHHMVSDTEKDPHTPKKGFWHAFIGWMVGPNPDTDYLVQDLMEDPFLRWFGTGPLPSKPWLNVFCCVGLRLLIWLVLGPVAALASALAGMVVFCLPNLINTLCHIPKLGYRRFNTPDRSTNIGGALAVLTVGESYHNNHHRYPKAITTSINPDEVDISGIVLKYL